MSSPFTIEKYASQMFTSKYGNRLDTRFKKLKEEFNELIEAYDDYINHKDNLEHVIEELSDVEAVLSHIRTTISQRTHDESLMEAILKVRIREHNKDYLRK